MKMETWVIGGVLAGMVGIARLLRNRKPGPPRLQAPNRYADMAYRAKDRAERKLGMVWRRGTLEIVGVPGDFKVRGAWTKDGRLGWTVHRRDRSLAHCVVDPTHYEMIACTAEHEIGHCILHSNGIRGEEEHHAIFRQKKIPM